MNVKELKRAFEEDNFSKYFGIEVIELSEGYAKTKLKITNQLMNFFGSGHGGAIYAIADVAFSLACNADNDIEIAVALNSNINYIKKVNENDELIAEAKVISSSKRTSITDIKIYNQNNELVAKFEGLAYLRRSTKVKN
ncbi:MAG: PaaI family thioesterase [Candidatus Helarchaeota archaeon]